MSYLRLNALLATLQAAADAPHPKRGEINKLRPLSDH